jgi:hypothetical protein
MLCAILALIATGCFVFMVVAILISLQLSDKLHRVERELRRQETDLRRGPSDSLAREIRLRWPSAVVGSGSDTHET